MSGAKDQSPKRTRQKIGRASSSSPLRSRHSLHTQAIGFRSPTNERNTETQNTITSPSSPEPTPPIPLVPFPTPDERFFSKPKFVLKTKGFQRFRAPDPPTKRSPLTTQHKEILQSFHDELNSCFENLGQIGVGSFGVVYLVRSRCNMPPGPTGDEVKAGELYALKQTKNPSIQSVEEWRNAVALGPHPNLIRYIRLFVPRVDNQSDSHHIMAVAFLMEYVGDHTTPIPRDPSLYTKLWNDAVALPESVVWAYTRDLLEALRHIHSRGFIHMDVKPENIMAEHIVNPVTGQTQVRLKLGDFGTMRQINAPPGDVDEGDKKYVAKELLNWTSQPTPSADMFSLGILILEMATNLEVPNSGYPYDALRIPDLSEVPGFSSLSRRLQKLILSLLTPDPMARPSAEYLLSGEEYPDLRPPDDKPFKHTRRHSNPSKLPSIVSNGTLSPTVVRGNSTAGTCTPMKSKSQPTFAPQTLPNPRYLTAPSTARREQKVGLSTTKLQLRRKRNHNMADDSSDDDLMDVEPRQLNFTQLSPSK